MKEMIVVDSSGDRLGILVDDEDYENLVKYKWRILEARNGTYVMRHSSRQEKEKGYLSSILMHRQILGILTKSNLEIDHRNGDGLDNRKENLRIATRSQNNMNRTKGVRNSSQYKGVSWHEVAGKWVAYAGTRKNLKYLGLFINEIDAALAYNEAVSKLYGEFAHLNIIT